MNSNFSVTNTTRSRSPFDRFDGLTAGKLRASSVGEQKNELLRKIKTHILGKDYELSLVFIGDTRSKTLNKKYRKKDKVANVLSFPLSKAEGEIFINLSLAKKECQLEKTTIKSRICYLFIHGCLHLKGLQHGATMDRQEMKLVRWFKV